LKESKEINHQCFHVDYNNLISKVSLEFEDSFAALASPTLSKQETVTYLYNSIRENEGIINHKPGLPWLKIFLFIPRIIFCFCRVIYAATHFKVHHIPKNAIVFRTWFGPNSINKSLLVDSYFGELTDQLAEYENVVVTFTPDNLRSFNKVSKNNLKSNHVISYGLLDLRDIYKLFLEYISSALIVTKKQYFLNGNEVTTYINRSLLIDYLGMRSFEAYAEKYKCEKLLSHKIKAFIYVFENQSWEKVCCKTLRKHDVRIIGYQSSGFSPLFLNFFPTKIDSVIHPMPDMLLTVGEYFKKYLLEKGSYTIPVEVFSAIRFKYPFDNNYFSVLSPIPDIHFRILFAFSVHKIQYKFIINDLISVFKESSISVDLKFHPDHDLAKIKEEFELPDNINIIESVEDKALRNMYDIVLFNDNSFGIESLLCGVKSYQYCRESFVSDNRFLYFSLWDVNYKINDLRILKKNYELGNIDKEFDIKKVKDYVNKMYQPFTNDSCQLFYNFINQPIPSACI
jgi:hypothetical protein